MQEITCPHTITCYEHKVEDDDPCLFQISVDEIKDSGADPSEVVVRFTHDKRDQLRIHELGDHSPLANDPHEQRMRVSRGQCRYMTIYNALAFVTLRIIRATNGTVRAEFCDSGSYLELYKKHTAVLIKRHGTHFANFRDHPVSVFVSQFAHAA